MNKRSIRNKGTSGHGGGGRGTVAEAAPRERIIKGARRHFFAHGFRSVTMDDLAAELGMSKKTLYGHFGSKDALLEAVLVNKFEQLGGDLEEITAEEGRDFLMSLSTLLACFQKHMAEIGPGFIRDIRRGKPEMFKQVETRRREYLHRHFGKLFSDGREAGLIRDDIPLNLIIEILLGAVQAVMNPVKVEELGLSLKDGFLTIIKILLEGVLTEHGRRKI